MGIRMLTINVNGYDIQAKYREEDIKTVFMPFLQHVIQLQKEIRKKTHSLSGGSSCNREIHTCYSTLSVCQRIGLYGYAVCRYGWISLYECLAR